MQRSRIYTVLWAGSLALSNACTPDKLVSPPTGSTLPPEIVDQITASGETGPVAVAEVLNRVTGEVRRTAISPALSSKANRVDGRPRGLSFDIAPQDLLLILHPSGQRTVFFTSDTLEVIRWRFFCPTTPVTQLFNVMVQDVSQRAIAGTGGHGLSHIGAKPVARHKRQTAQTPPDGFFFDTLVAERAAGDEVLSIRYVADDQGSPCRGQIQTQEFFTATRVEALEQLQPQANMPLNVISSDHSDLYWMVPQAVPQVYAAANNYVAVAGGVLTVTAATLPFGGLQDVPNTWSTVSPTGQVIGHNTHRVGTDVDYDGPGDNQRVWRRIIRAGRRAGFLNCEVHGRSHVHCYAALYR
jgi:hypothetical protein